MCLSIAQPQATEYDKNYTHNYGQHRNYESSWTTPAGMVYMDAAHWSSTPRTLQDMYESERVNVQDMEQSSECVW